MAAAYWNVNERNKQLAVVGGAVAVIVLVKLDGRGGGMIYCSNVGDARAVLCLGSPADVAESEPTADSADPAERRKLDASGLALRLSRDFKPFDDDEYERIVNLGGFISLRDGGDWPCRYATHDTLPKTAWSRRCQPAARLM